MVFVFVGLSVFLFLFALLRIWLGEKVRLEQRVQEIIKRQTATELEQTQTKSNLIPKKANMVKWNLVKKFERELIQVGVRLSRQEMTVIGLVVLVLMGLAIVVAKNVFAPILLIVLMYLGYKTFLSVSKGKRMKKFEVGLGEAISAATGALKTGYSLFQAMDTVAQETKGQVGEEFGRILKEISLGVTVEDAFAHAQERVRSRDFDLIVNAVLIQRQVGGNLAEVLDIVADTIRERLRMQGEIRALTAQGRMSMWIFVLMAPAITLALLMFNPSYMSVMWSTKTGLGLLVLAGVGEVVGAVVIRRIVHFDL